MRRGPLIAGILLALASLGCGDDELSFGGSWSSASRNFGGPFGHDQNPLRSERFIVYSGDATTSARRYAADVAEESLTELEALLAVGANDYDFLPRYDEDKIHIFAVGSQDFENNTGIAYRDGIIVISRDNRNYRRFGFDGARYKRLIKHETMHVVEFLLIGDPVHQQASDVWWREGFATWVTGQNERSVRTVAQVEQWRQTRGDLKGGGNPVAVHVWSDFPSSVLEAADTFSYYAHFALAVDYVMSPEGLGGTPSDVVALYDELGRGRSFRAAFADQFGVSLAEFQRSYFDRIAAFLPP